VSTLFITGACDSITNEDISLFFCRIALDEWMLKISSFYLYSVRSYSTFKMAENGSHIKIWVPLCCLVGHNSSGIDMKFGISSWNIFYFTCAKYQTKLSGSCGGLSQNWLNFVGMTRVLFQIWKFWQFASAAIPYIICSSISFASFS